MGIGTLNHWLRIRLASARERLEDLPRQAAARLLPPSDRPMLRALLRVARGGLLRIGRRSFAPARYRLRASGSRWAPMAPLAGEVAAALEAQMTEVFEENGWRTSGPVSVEVLVDPAGFGWRGLGCRITATRAPGRTAGPAVEEEEVRHGRDGR
jgi:hypothetical protein